MPPSALTQDHTDTQAHTKSLEMGQVQKPELCIVTTSWRTQVCLFSWLLLIPGALWPFRSDIGCFTVWSHSWGVLLNVKAFVLKIVLSLVLRMANVFIKSDCSWNLEGRDIFFLWVCLSSGLAWQLAFVETRDLQFWGQSQQSLTWQAWMSLVVASPFQHAPS